MTTNTNKTLVQEYLGAIRKDKSDATVSRFVADEVLKQHIALYEASFPGYWIETEDLVAEGDIVVLRGKVHGTHSGQLMEIPPTGKQIAIPIFIAYRVADGKIVEHWMLADMLGLLQQIGVMPAAL